MSIGWAIKPTRHPGMIQKVWEWCAQLRIGDKHSGKYVFALWAELSFTIAQVLISHHAPVLSQTGYSTSPRLILACSAGILWSSNGTLPQTSTYNTTPKLHTSTSGPV